MSAAPQLVIPQEEQSPDTVREPHAPFGCEDEFDWEPASGLRALVRNDNAAPFEEPCHEAISVLDAIRLSTPDPVELPYSDPIVWGFSIRAARVVARIARAIAGVVVRR